MSMGLIVLIYGFVILPISLIVMWNSCKGDRKLFNQLLKYASEHCPDTKENFFNFPKSWVGFQVATKPTYKRILPAALSTSKDEELIEIYNRSKRYHRNSMIAKGFVSSFFPLLLIIEWSK
jgi:hypothetical protein